MLNEFLNPEIHQGFGINKSLLNCQIFCVSLLMIQWISIVLVLRYVISHFVLFKWTGGELCAGRAVFAGDPESKQLLDAFFLGKALAETVSERIGSLVGELLSEVGQRQAEQQRQIREFQVMSPRGLTLKPVLLPLFLLQIRRLFEFKLSCSRMEAMCKCELKCP